MQRTGRAVVFHERVLLAPSTCPRVVEHDGALYACGLDDWDHSGPCTWWTPGSYLAPRLITPLDWLAVGWPGAGPLWRVRCCPACGAGVSYISGEFQHMIYCDAGNAERDEIHWRFEPCGCEGRELTQGETTPGS
jgi:hypothetical protein